MTLQTCRLRLMSKVRWQAGKDQLQLFQQLSPENGSSKSPNLALAVVHVPDSLDSGRHHCCLRNITPKQSQKLYRGALAAPSAARIQVSMIFRTASAKYHLTTKSEALHRGICRPFRGQNPGLDDISDGVVWIHSSLPRFVQWSPGVGQEAAGCGAGVRLMVRSSGLGARAWRAGLLSAFERRGNNLKDSKNSDLKAKARFRIWP